MDLREKGIKNLLAGLKEIGKSLNLSDNQITSLEGLPKEIGESLTLRDNPNITTIPEGSDVKGSIFADKIQKGLIKDAERKGYMVEVEGR